MSTPRDCPPAPKATGFLEDLLAVEDVARMLKLRPSTIRAYAERGSLPSVLVGNRLRFRPSDVGLWIARRYRKGGS
jgi:excisionase family DNA binding protein